jgi:hypothetical protein
MSQLSQLQTDLKTLQEKIYSANFDILSMLPILSKEEIVKNIILAKNQAMQVKDAEVMVYGYAKSSIPGGVGTPDPNLSGIYPIKKDHALYQEADKILKSLREAGMRLVKEGEAIAVDLITTSVKIANSVAAMVILMAPLSFNVPAAISLLLLIIDAIGALIKRITDVITLLEPLTQLILVVDITSLISNVSNSLTSAVNSFANAAGAVANNVSTATTAATNVAINAAPGSSLVPNTANNLTGAGSAAANAGAGVATAAIGVGAAVATGAAVNAISNLKLPNIPRIGTPEYNSYFDSVVVAIDVVVKLLISLFEPISIFQQIIEWLLGELTKAANNAKSANPTQSSSTIFPTKDDLNSKSVAKYLDLLKGLTSSFSIPDYRVESGTQSGTSSYVYDVLLPDGTVLSNLDDNSFESIKERYNVIFNTDASV